MPFFEKVTRGKNVPRERLTEVAEHYDHFGGAGLINQRNRELIAALSAELLEHGCRLPIYWGNRNGNPLLPDAIRQMRDDGVQRALAFVTSAFSSYSGCRQYRENIERGRFEVGLTAAPVAKLRPFYNHPGFIEAVADRVGGLPWSLVYQSRSGLPGQPWLELDIADWLREFPRQNERTHVVVIPIGFISDHVEVLFDLDHEATAIAETYGLQLIRAGTVGKHPRFVRMIRELMTERIEGLPPQSPGSLGPNLDVCPETCCLSARRAMSIAAT